MTRMSICQFHHQQEMFSARPCGQPRFTFSGLKLSFRVLIAFLALLASHRSWGGSVALIWYPDIDPAVAGYNVYYGLQSHNYSTLITSGTNGSITLPGLTDGATYYFAITARDATGTESTSSGEIAYTLPIIPPTIAAPPLSLTNFAEAPAVFAVTATGTAPFLFQWYRNGVALTDNGVIAGSSTATLTLFSPLPDDAGNYTVTVSNPAGSVTSTAAVLTMINNQVFTPAAGVAMAGQYNGLFYLTNSSGTPVIAEPSAGMLANCTVSSNRTYTSKLYVAGVAYGIAGLFDLTGNDSRVISRTGPAGLTLSNLTVSLHIDWSFGTKEITGTVSNMDSGNAWVSTLVANEATNALPGPSLNLQAYLPPAAGAPITSPGGYGVISIASSTKGVVTIVGTLADASVIFESVPVSKDLTIPVFVSLYSGRGLLEGWVSLASGAPTGALTWLNTTTNARSAYPNGFTTSVPLQSLLP